MKHLLSPRLWVAGVARQTVLGTALALAAPALLAQAPAAPVSSLPAAAASRPVWQPPQQFQLDNGLTVIVQPDRRAPTAVQMLWVRVGSMDEVDGTTGVAHVLEHMMFKGTPSLKPGEFSRRVAALGGRENAFTSRDMTGYHQQIPVERLDEMMALEADRFAHSQWPDDEFRREIEVVKEERRMRTEDQPRALMGEQQNAVTFIASPYRRPVVGWMSDLEAMTPQDAREFFQRWYVPANAALVIAGDVDVAQVRALAQKHYGAIPARAVPVRKPQAEPEQRGMRRLDFKAPAEQSYVSLVFRVPQIDAQQLDAPTDAWALLVLSALLDGYTGARLGRALTQGPDRVADSASAWYGLTGRGPQLFGLTGVPAAGKTPQAVEAALRAQVARIAQEGVGEAELARVKTQWVASETYKRDSVMAQARELGSHWVQGLPLDASERMIEKLRAVTSAQVQAVAARYFGDDQLTVATLWPQPVDPKAAAARARGFAAPAGAMK
ncbi:pitrilysin family protein [Xenophilus arseniciresistens]|uniref:Pitrilysin family protein n=1 Tax=Xenophilus arseniciresistens TaxID=1283306 RepID=A0AAE3N4U9_9BURK|nr:pitrilysin family protein [Xenophilus arseniciresistens]MDA7415570.1 pitrilysin family protein [Xenophilus arseniciresistens]